MIHKISQLIQKVAGKDIDFIIESPTEKNFGDYSTNIAFKLAPKEKKAPLAIAQELAKKIKEIDKKKFFEKIEAAVPGFINFWISQKTLQKELKEILIKRKEKREKRKALKINIEFVSANPTGPLTMANGRGGFYGDVLANVLEKTGHKVTREYYINDTGNQIRLLGESVLAAKGRIPEKEEHYKGEYIKRLAISVKRLELNKNPEIVGKKIAKILLKEIKSSLKKAGIKHDIWFSEDKNLHKKGEFKKTLEFLKKKGVIEKREGALWLDDAVLIKSDGMPTYFLADLTYHYDKFLKRKFDIAIDVWGADHHGYASRMKKGIKALGINPERLKIIITQLVRLVSKGREIKISKRKGEFITLDDLIKEVGADAARFFFLMHSLDSHMDFDLDLAKERSQKNPVYYAQYAFVRCNSILTKAISNFQFPISKQFSKSKLTITNYQLHLLSTDSEIKLMLELAKFPDVLAQTAKDYQIHRLTNYALELARAFHNFYEKERVLNALEENLKNARLALVLVTKIILENLFDILGISKPKKM
jgi:arginyl-tRNA synthetase